jgi:GT2 family glycosyltransferase
MSEAGSPQPKVSVVVLSYKGPQWLARCLESLEAQTLFSEMEVVVSENDSRDGSAELAEQWLARTGRGRVVRNPTNLFYCEANNKGAEAATGRYLLFLNHDARLEPDCLQKLYEGAEAAGADAAAPLVMDYDSDNFQSLGGAGIDWLGVPQAMRRVDGVVDVFASPGCSLLIRAEMFRRIGMFDPRWLMYVDEPDICWRVWIAGGRIVTLPAARVHHRGAVLVNPAGDTKTVESRTSDTKRHLTNRNGLLLLLKNGQHLFLLLVLPHLLWLAFESLALAVLARRWSCFRRVFLEAVRDTWRLRGHVREMRRRIRGFRRRGDFYMLRFLRLKPSRWDDLLRVFRLGAPRVDSK